MFLEARRVRTSTQRVGGRAVGGKRDGVVRCAIAMRLELPRLSESMRLSCGVSVWVWGVGEKGRILLPKGYRDCFMELVDMRDIGGELGPGFHMLCCVWHPGLFQECCFSIYLGNLLEFNIVW